jgi:hypothetical protein
MEKTTLYLPPELKRELELAAKRTGRRQADIVREALGEYLAGQDRPPLRSIGSGSSGRHARTDMKPLRAEWRRHLEEKYGR